MALVAHRQDRDARSPGPVIAGAADAPRRRLELDLAWVAVAVASFAYAALALVFNDPLAPHAVTDHASNLDASYQIALADLFARGARFGDEIFFTYGPLGFLAAIIRPPSVVPAYVAISSIYYVGFVGLAVGVARRSRVPWWAALAALCVLATVTRGFEPRTYGLAILLVAYLQLAGERASLPLLLLGSAILGVASLVKFTFLPLGIGIGVIVAAGDLWRGRTRGLLLLATIVASPLLVWLALYGTLADVPGHLAGSVEIARGYSEAMQVYGPPGEVWLFLATSLLLLALQLVTGPPALPGDRLALAAALAVVLFVVFKHAFVRHDAHALLGWWALLYAALATLPVRLRSQRRGIRAAALAGIALAVALQPYGTRHRSGYYAALAAADVGGIPENAARATSLLLGDGMAGLAGAWRALLDQVAARNPVPAVAAGATVDLYPWDQRLVFAHRLAWRPRPVFQSYAAYTERLLRWNADQLREQGPDRVLASLATIDDRFPTLDDGPSWRVLLERYRAADAADAGGEYLLLERGAASRPLGAVAIGERELRFAEPLVLDAHPGTLVWVTLDVAPTLGGELRKLLYKLPVLLLELTLEDGSTRRFRLVPEMARAGFVLSPLVGSTAELRPVLARDHAGIGQLPRVRSFLVTSDSPAAAALYGDRVKVTLEALSLPSGD